MVAPSGNGIASPRVSREANAIDTSGSRTLFNITGALAIKIMSSVFPSEPLQTASKIAGLKGFFIVEDTRVYKTIKSTVMLFIKRNIYRIVIHLANTVVILCNFFDLVYKISEQGVKTYDISFLVTTMLVFITSKVALVFLWMREMCMHEAAKIFVQVDQKITRENSVKLSQRSTTFFIVMAGMYAGIMLNEIYMYPNLLAYLVGVIDCFKEFVILAVTTNYINLIILIKQRLNILSRQLCNYSVIKETNGTFFQVKLSTLTECNMNCTPIRLPQSSRNSLSDLFGSDVSVDTERDRYIQRIVNLRAAYNYLCKVTSLTNYAYGVPVLFYFMSFWAAIINNLLWMLLHLFTPTYMGINKAAPNGLDINLLWTLFYFTQAVAIVYVCSATVQARQTIKDDVIGLLSEPGLYDDVAKELLLFSDVITRRKLEFSGCGFFKIDLPFITTLVASVMTYLIIFIQLSE